MNFLITLVGLVLIIEGLPYVACPAAMQNWLRRLSEADPEHLRVMGLVAMVMGVLLCYLGRKALLM